VDEHGRLEVCDFTGYRTVARQNPDASPATNENVTFGNGGMRTEVRAASRAMHVQNIANERMAITTSFY
jgi:hypothetical protein